jgi:putative tricarboxylic transport membrane protein
MEKADLVTSLLLIGLGSGAVIESWRMPRLEELAINPYTVPGIVPGLLGAIIVLLGSILLVRSLRRGGWRLGIGGAWNLLGHESARRLYLSLVLTFGYAAGLVGKIPYWLATVVFVALFIALFEWRSASTQGRRVRALAIALGQAVAVATAVTMVFQYLFLVRLP